MYNKLFNQIKQKLETSSLWTAMSQCEEKSPYHRESSVVVHTQMVLDEYIPLITSAWTRNDFIIATTLLFHDCGKPLAKIEKFSEARGNYYAFYGHELISSRLFVDFVLADKELSKIFRDLGYDVLFITAWLIEYHKPWDVSDKTIRDMMMRTIAHYLGDVDVFIDILLADSYGRISDDKIEQTKRCNDWVNLFRSEYDSKSAHFNFLNTSKSSRPKAYFLIGASGSGKTTFTNNTSVKSIFSLDLMRLELYGNDYSYSFTQSTKDKHFKAKCKQRLLDLARLNGDMIVDNTNTSKKTRQYHLAELCKRNYHTIGVVFLTSLKTNIDRQTTRKDKSIPVEAVERQFRQMQLPSLGEFDEIIVIVN